MKYFYNDPLAAAWMAKSFGMKFVCVTGINPDREVNLPDILNAAWYQELKYNERIGKYGFRWCIHPDSLHLLEPQVGDFVERTSIPARVSSKECDFALDISFVKSQGDFRVIQRNGISFMWPESENL